MTKGPSTLKKLQKKLRSKWKQTALALFVLVVAAVLISGIFRAQNKTQVSEAVGCTISTTLVNSCRPWFGGFSFRTGSLTADVADVESRIGRPLEVVRSYFPLGRIPLNNENKTMINRTNTIVFTNYKPAVPWANATGSNATINAQIDAAADSIKSMAPKKIMLSLDAEPEDDVSSGVSCTTLAAKHPSGSPADYRAMWQNVRNRFDTKGVTNVVWVMNYMGFSRWDCIVKDMYPGNNLVDWVMWDPYAGNGETWDSSVSRFYNVLTNQTDANHAFTSKTWGIAEWGSWHSTQTNAYQYYADAKTAIETNRYPKLKLYSFFDNTGVADSRIDYTLGGVSDPVELTNFRTLANSPAFQDPTTAMAPEVVFTANPNTVTAGGSVSLSWTVKNADSCAASNGWTGSKLSGDGTHSQTVQPITSTTYTLTCTNTGGNTVQSVTVNVSPSTKLGDINNPPNGDGVVNIADLSYLITKWGSSDARADITDDGTVSPADLAKLISLFGT
jgi:hypothetical protein